MPIEFRCPVCNQTLRVPDQHAGQQAKCPQCQQLATVPTAGADPFAPPASSEFAPPNFGAEVGTADQWKLKTRTGDTFGPVTRAELDRWMSDGRVDAATQLMQEGWTRWKPAGEVYPALATGNPYQSGQFSGTAAGAFRESPGQYAYVKPHRGSLVLALGITSIVFCGAAGIPAWIMGSADLKEIREGRMDRMGEGTTQAGYVTGIIGTILFLLQLAFVLLYIVFIVGIIAAGAAGAK